MHQKVSLYNSNRPMPKLGCVLMASGLGVRFGSNKLLADFHGEPLIKQVLSATNTDLFYKRVVVTRHKEVAELCRQEGIETILHDKPYRSDTVRIGLEFLEKEALETDSFDGCMFCSCDQPLLTNASIEAMAHTFFQQPYYIYRLSYEKTFGNPILFPKTFFPELKKLPQGKGGSFIAKKYSEQIRHVNAESEWELKDVDTPEDLELFMHITER